MTTSTNSFFKDAWLMEFKASYNDHRERIDDLRRRLECLLKKDFGSEIDIEEGRLRLTVEYMQSPEERGPLGSSDMTLDSGGTFSVFHDFHDVHYDNTKASGLNFYDALRLFVARISDNYEGNDRARAQDFLMGTIDKVTIEGRKVVLPKIDTLWTKEGRVPLLA